VTVGSNFIQTQNYYGSLFTVPSNYYVGYWTQVAQGPGIGQSRHIVSYTTNSDGTLSITVAPAFDVLPQISSLITVGRQYWQFFTIDNLVDHRTTDDSGNPLCQKSNQNFSVNGQSESPGLIGAAGQTSDSVTAGNVQKDTAGIALYEKYSAPSPLSGGDNSYKTFIEVRDNTITGEYQWGSGCRWGGIETWLNADPYTTPTVEGFGVSIAGNTITQSDGIHGGGINIVPTWFTGPPITSSAAPWKLSDGTLVFHNNLTNISNPVATPACGDGPARIGVKFRCAAGMAFDRLRQHVQQRYEVSE
jgi:hypothetical protein